jgi:hypothetical protein
MIGLPLQPEIGCGFDTAHGLRCDGEMRGFQAAARLDLDNEHKIAPPGDQIDFTEPRSIAPRNDPKAFQKKQHGSKAFGAVSAKESNALFLAEICHR